MTQPPSNPPADSYNQYTHCGHGKSYKDECDECEKLWALEVTLPNARLAVAKLMKFYDADSLIKLLFEQAHHVEKLQAKLPPLRDEFPRTPREG